MLPSGFSTGLPFKLLILTVLFVLIAEVLVFIPSVARFRLDWLENRVDRAYLASLSFEVASGDRLSRDFLDRLFKSADIKGLGLMVNGQTRLLLTPEISPSAQSNFAVVNLDEDGLPALIGDALATMFSSDDRYILVLGHPMNEPDVMVEMVVERAPLRAEMWNYAGSVLLLSLIICLIVAGLVYWALSMMFVRPMIRLTNNMAQFQENPADGDLMMIPSDRQDEIGEAEKVLASMQSELRQALGRQQRLATIGQSVSKINHDLRNVLASAVLMSDRLAKSDDPRVQKLSPKLVQALDRAVSLCRATVDYGKAEEIDLEQVNLFDLAEEVSEALPSFTSEEASVRVMILNSISPDAEALIDRKQMFRAVLNLVRNAAEALREAETKAAKIELHARKNDGVWEIDVVDNGPGVPDAAQAHLFVPFKGSVKAGGSGLGLAIAAETVRAHGGDIALMSTGPSGSVFRMTLPVTPTVH